MKPASGTTGASLEGFFSSNGKDPNAGTAAVIAKPGAAQLVLFDFDGTITTRDTLIEFVRFYRGNKKYLESMVMLAPILALYKLKLLPNWKAKQHFLARHFRGEKIEVFNSRCIEFSMHVLPSLIRPKALEAIRRYSDENVTMAVVSASAENWVSPFCDQEGMLCIATRLEVKDGLITGNLEGKNCYGDQKVCRIREQFDLSAFEKIIAYGDSSGDREMLQLAHDSFYKPWRE